MSISTSVDRHARVNLEHRRYRLERRYRQLLALYPKDHRREHGEEMVGVLLASALEWQDRRGSGQHVADVIDLVAGAARIRARLAAKRLRRPVSLRSAVRDSRWSDALAVVSVVAPLLLLIAALTQFNVPQSVASCLIGRPFWPLSAGIYAPDWPLTIGGPAVVILAFGRLRRTAGIVAFGTGIGQLAALPALGIVRFTSPALAFTSLLALTAAVSLLLSSGPARGIVLLRWWGTTLTGITGLVLGGLSLGGFSLSGTLLLATSSPVSSVPGAISSGFTADLPAEVAGLSGDILIAGVLTVVGLGCLFTPVTRRLVALLAIPLIPYAVIWQNKLGTDLIGQLNGTAIAPASAVVLYVAPLAVAFGIFIWGVKTRPSLSGG
jgi:hypothetical protein